MSINETLEHEGEPSIRPLTRIARVALALLKFGLRDYGPSDYIRPVVVVEVREDSEEARRRKWLGPSADVTHPEFGLRHNRPEEDFAISYKIERRQIPGFDCYSPEGPQHAVQTDANFIVETVKNHKGDVVATKPLGEIE